MALVDGGDRAAVFHPTAHTLLAYPFDTDGFDEPNPETLWRRLGDPAAWIDTYQDGVDWVHSRYRWVLDLDADQSSWSYERIA